MWTHHVRLACRQDFGHDVDDADLAGHNARCRPVVACHYVALQAHVAQSRHHSNGLCDCRKRTSVPKTTKIHQERSVQGYANPKPYAKEEDACCANTMSMKSIMVKAARVT
jgi:hypothetical protein